jgi:spermidine synthase
MKPSAPATPFSPSRQRRDIAVLLTSVMIIASCGILYELLISTISSYFQGSSVLHFSIVIGLFLSFMGVGSYLSRFVRENLLQWFIIFELLLSLVGGCSAVLLYFAFSLTPYFYGVAFCLIAVLGTLIGLEIPILTRIVRQYENLRDAMANVLSFDYLGALLASVAFPLVLLPTFGLMRTAFAIGLLNLLVAWLNTWLFGKMLRHPLRLHLVCAAGSVMLIAGFIWSFALNGFFEQFLYRDQVMLSRQSTYQQIVVTKWNEDIRLFLDGNIQFSSQDEYRYHEPLVHAPLALALQHQRVLVLGGGDGLAARELLRQPGVEAITVVDLDPMVTDLGRDHPVFTRLNDSAFHDLRVQVVNEDAYKFVENSSDFYDVVIIDLPDPNHPSLGKLYTVEFYGLLEKRLAVGGAIITQSTSPYFAPEAFWCIHRSLEEVFAVVLPMTVNVPSFGPWGFNLALKQPARVSPEHPDPVAQATTRLQQRLFQENLSFRYLSPEVVPTLFAFEPDIAERPVEPNRLSSQILVQYYEQSWENWR